MSDQSQGPGWWRASDDKWYPPELHPDRLPPAPRSEAIAGPRDPVPSPGNTAPRDDAPQGSSASSSGPLQGKSPGQLVVLGCAAIVGLGCFLPWASISFLGTFTVSGTDDGGDGWIFLGGAVVLGVLAWRKPPGWPTLIVSLLGLTGFIYERHEIGTADGVAISIGIGLWLIVAASLVAATASIHSLTEGRPVAPIARRLPPAVQRYWWGIGLAVVLVVGTIAYGQEHHVTEGFGPIDAEEEAAFGFEEEEEEPDPTECATGGDTTLVADVADLASYWDGISGTLTIELLETRELPSSFDDEFVDEPITADGSFIGIRVRVTNEASEEVQPSAVFDEWRLTDGDASWAVADYSGRHMGVSGSWSAAQGDEQPETEVAAGFDTTTWAVFDIPTSTSPAGLAVRLTDGQTCLALP